MIATLAVSLSVPPDASIFQLTPTLQELIQKLASFGARIEELTPVGLVAMFGLEPMENATGRAAHAAPRDAEGGGTRGERPNGGRDGDVCHPFRPMPGHAGQRRDRNGRRRQAGNLYRSESG